MELLKLCWQKKTQPPNNIVKKEKKIALVDGLDKLPLACIQLSQRVSCGLHTLDYV